MIYTVPVVFNESVKFNNGVEFTHGIDGDLVVGKNLDVDGKLKVNEFTDIVDSHNKALSMPSGIYLHHISIWSRQWGFFYINIYSLSDKEIKHLKDGTYVAGGYVTDTTVTPNKVCPLCYVEFISDSIRLSYLLDNNPKITNAVGTQYQLSDTVVSL